ncbi:MAG TPA: ACP S-malonyltransferase [Acidobacteriota bacterium]|nr:ACP S-malonyltransferase [Acidobacteriota bacterium]HNT16679.1 ACP S-malonyltransferase [Acidobacteriota bacterium]HPA26258.1 ACP S-malonyltransferase [Acidobacteriota bacterium]HQO19558.1 ACP S-malonyltransferase [Acidobacteriota bacterium]HQQ46266.1 ACP S-malonyltransferase [Acidobacteriota bacterium]
MKTAFLFPGQASQFVGMGKELCDAFPEAKAIFDKANELLEPSFTSLLWEGPQEKLNLTENTQPAVLAVSVAAWQCLWYRMKGFAPSFVAGHSLGEYSAHVAAGTISFEDAIVAVRKRGLFMQEAVPVGEGAMAAMMGIEIEDVRVVCEAAASTGIVVPANDNAPGQIVIAGSKAAVEKAVELAKEKGCRKAVFLPVSAPFHSPLMKPAREKMEPVLKSITFSDPLVPCVANATASPVTRAEDARELLVRQVDSPVRWRETLLFLRDQGVDTLVEIGPQTVLSGIAKRVSKDWAILNVGDPGSLEETEKALIQKG